MSEMKDSGKGMPVIDRIMVAKKTLGVSPREIAEEMRHLQSENNIAGMQSLFNVYKNWESRERKSGVSDEQVEELASRNFDTVAKVADEQDNTKDDLLAMARSIKKGNKGGKITKFFRNAVNHEAPEERTDNFDDN